MRPLVFILFVFFVQSSRADSNRMATDSTCFLDSSELRLLLEANQAMFYRLEGDVVEDSIRVPGKDYFMNYAVSAKTKLNKARMSQLRFALLDCGSKSTLVNKCSFKAEYAILITKNDHTLLLFFSGADFCGGQVKVIKIRNKQESSATFNNRDFTELFK